MTPIPTEGTVSHGTLRMQDLLRTFARELERLSPDHAELVATARADADMLDEPEVLDRAEDEDAALDTLEFVLDALSLIAAQHGLEFCAHEGDGSNFGFWPVQP